MVSPKLFFLGAPKFELGKKTIELASAKSIALLAILAIQREPQTRERVLGLLWAESSDDAARKNLRNALWAIRKALGEAAVMSVDDTLALGENVWADVREFETISDFKFQISDSPGKSEIENLKSKIDFYRGAFLDGLTLTDAPEYEIWLTTERERLAQIYSHALAQLVDAHRAQANWRAVIETARRALAHDNLQEPIYRALMHAHAQVGERAEALREYTNLRATLERELGVAPLPESEQLRAAILRGEITPPAPARATKRPHAETKTRLPYIGRRAELSTLDDELRAASLNTARVALISGEVGIGKSRLWQEWSQRILSGTERSGVKSKDALILSARCLDATRTLPFAPIAQMFNHPNSAREIFVKPSPVASVWLSEIARLLPNLRATFPDLSAPASLSPDEERQRIFEALAQCLLALRARPLVLFVDDLHWADRSTLDWLGFLTHRLRDHAILIVGAYRPEDAPAPLTHRVANWGREGIVRRIALSRLTPAESQELVVALGVDPGIAERAQKQSAGNPYFLIELARAAPGAVPPALTELIRARIAQLDETARQVAQAAAVLESDFDFHALKRASGRGEEETLDALDALGRANILIERESRYDFAHPLVGAIVRDGLSGARRAFLHRRVADALEAIHARDLSPLAARLSAHYENAGDTSRAAQYAELAAEHARAVAAPVEAIQFYQRALALESTPARQMRLGEILSGQGELESARQVIHAAIAGFEERADERGAARACLALAQTFLGQARQDDVTSWVERALRFVNMENEPRLHAQAHFLLGASRRQSTQSLDEAEKHLSEAVRLIDENHFDDMASAYHLELGNLLAERGDLPGAIAAFRDTIALAEKFGDTLRQTLGLNNVAYHSLLANDVPSARQFVESGLQVAAACGLRMPLQFLYSTRGEIALAENQWDEAAQWFERGLAEAERSSNTTHSANLRANLGLVARGKGDLDSARVLLEAARQAAAKFPAPHLQTQIDLWLAEVYRARGERATFDEALTRAETRLAHTHRAQLMAWARRLRQA
ncbi:MAG: AAA family ATPase [Chloroflexi bacterium]|nr:AAA family ATPase [Chloroflexota bacterium]